ncbi:protein-tyrosine phosphatase-like protein, partial [Phellopilus nigrolimitatus]
IERGPSEIIPRLYLGNFHNASDHEELARLQVTHVLSVLEANPSFAFENDYGATLKKLHLPLQDSFAVNILAHLDQTTSFIHEALEDPNAVHCFQGISRSATVVAAYLLAHSPDFTSAADVLRFMKSKRSVVAPNHGFVRQLDEYVA